MKRTIALIAAAVVLIGGGAFAYLFWFAGGSGEPSTELTTPDLIGATTTSAGTTESTGASNTTVPAGNAGAFVIDPGQSTASFQIDEVLNGSPNTVIGTTDQVAGQVVIDTGDLGATQFSPIVVNARTFATDSDRRDRAIRGPVILNSASDDFEFITFTPTSIDGLVGATAEVGGTYEFEVTGDLAVRGTSNTVTFAVTVEMVDDGTITGIATTEILRSDFGIGIPSVPSVADVTDEVALTLEFVAVSS